MDLESANLPDVGEAQRRADELVKRIKKLRWAGLETEAAIVAQQVSSLETPTADSVVAEPWTTD